MYVDILAFHVIVPTVIHSSCCLSIDSHCMFPIGICGKGEKRIYLIKRIPTYDVGRPGIAQLSWIQLEIGDQALGQDAKPDASTHFL